MYAGLLEQLAAHRLLERLAGLDEAGQRRIEPRGEDRLAPQQHLAAVFGEHDHDRVDARKVLGAAMRTAAPPAGTERHGRRTAVRAVAVAVMPVDHAARAAVQRRLGRRQARQPLHHAERAVDRTGLIEAQLGKARHPLVESQQHQFVVRGSLRQRHPPEPARGVDQRLQAVEHQQARMRVGACRGEFLLVGAQVFGAIERGAGEAGCGGHGRSPVTVDPPADGASCGSCRRRLPQSRPQIT
ncbi:MAG: hypothetical protein CALGDGBN_01936 [Pseudomonadales bacterium]|nr:hypothetical protein [Pseudomonadales bacterium]